MNHCGVQQNSNYSSCEEMRSSVSVSLSFDNGDTVVCPKPRRLNLFNTNMNEPVRPIRWQMCYQQEPYDSKAGPELLDIIFAKGGGYGSSDQPCTQVASSPPFFCGSPPSRVSNPLIQDARFGDDKISPISPHTMIPNPTSGMSTSSPSSSARKGGCLRGNYGNKPAVRIEGFDCLDRDNRRNCSIPALA
ncbi:uncharacterized protein LOC112524715 [Cynara cardunculus var. scolymus]|uniref:Uncharacterized protein n=1 Tax=Cynara cardunculus var. scolymus TaxID=59895 RepID=A0A103YA58_CYNCS|nr:uncharacterized protein LOC112524715 [Cynara cardunculus var. scolymus]KVI05318.1 hypothetical protein Ccrd_016359 [Cynara cardunculus var. scolymus]